MNYDEEADFNEKRDYVRDLLLYLEPVASGLENWRALEIGGGGGVLAGLLGRHFGHVTSTDLFTPDLRYDGQLSALLKDKFGRNNEDYPMQKVEFISADAQRLQFRDYWFDICYSQNAFEHIPNPEAALRESVRVTRPGGFVYLQFDPVWSADSGSHFVHLAGDPWGHLFQDDDTVVAKMVEAGATELDIADFRSAMNRRPIGYYHEMFPRVIDELRLEVVIHHEWSGTVDPSWTEHPNLGKAAAALGVPEEDLLVRGMRYLLRTPAYL
jgi:ubiquinone/menaquinone biosynthesis C-methylase UbiE